MLQRLPLIFTQLKLVLYLPNNIKQIVSLLYWAKEHQIIYEDEYDIHQFREHIYSKPFHSEFK